MAYLYDTVQVRPSCLIIYPTYEGFKRVLADPFHTRHNLHQHSNRPVGTLSDNARRRLRYAFKLLIATADEKKIALDSTGKTLKFKLGFITLTLPAEQDGLSDSYIKEKCLNNFLMATQKKYGKMSYVWKAEAQGNGNIHFHLTCNKFIPYWHLRNYWNSALAHTGLIDQYRQNMQEFHKGGFKVREDLLKHWPLEAQQKAYEFGQATNWSQPNTIDVHAVKNIKNMESYLEDYFCKKEEDKRPIMGKIWGCSRNLSYTNKFTFDMPDITAAESEFLRSKTSIIRIEGSEAVVVPLSAWERERYLPERITNRYNNWLCKVKEHTI